jgi:hypothetical protein
MDDDILQYVSDQENKVIEKEAVFFIEIKTRAK